MKKIFILAIFALAASGCETVNEAGRSVEKAFDNLGENSRDAAKDVGDAGNEAADNVKSGGE